MSRSHLHGEDEALVAVDNAVRVLDVLRRLLVAAFKSGHIAQADNLPSDGIGEDNQFREFVDVAVWDIHMDDRRAVSVISLACDGSETVSSQFGCNHRRRHCVLGHARGVHVDGDFFLLLAHDFDVAHRFDVAQAFREAVGEVAQLAR